jgi:hypothetical protein
MPEYVDKASPTCSPSNIMLNSDNALFNQGNAQPLPYLHDELVFYIALLLIIIFIQAVIWFIYPYVGNLAYISNRYFPIK